MEHPPRRSAAASRHRGQPSRFRPSGPTPRTARHPSRSRRPPPPPRRARASFLASLGPILLAALAGPWPASAAEPLAPPTGEVLLVVTGDITLPNVGDEAHLDRGHLEALPRARFTTDTPWSEHGPHEFSGVRLNALLAAVGANGTRFRASASDDYGATFEGIDLERYPVIIADTRDGESLTVRTLGPLRIMLPFDDHPELLTDTNVAISVWQLVAMDVR